jgi:hypothetical protein
MYCLDAPILEDKSAENINEAAKTVGSMQVLTHFGGEYGRDSNGNIIDIMPNSNLTEKEKTVNSSLYPNFVKAMKEIGYSGYFSYELCHPLPIVNGQTVGIEFVDQCAGLACEMMKGLINNV